MTGGYGVQESELCVQTHRNLVSNSLVLTIMLRLTALACPNYDYAGFYMVEEVVLNKPGVEYELSRLAERREASCVEYFASHEAYMYKSHHDEGLIVLVPEQGLRYVASAPSDKPTTLIDVRGLNVDLEQVSNSARKAENELGWKAEPAPHLLYREARF